MKARAIDAQNANLAEFFFSYLEQPLQDSEYVIFGLAGVVDPSNQLFSETVVAFEKKTARQVHMLNGVSLTPDQINQCPRPCWVYVPSEMFSEIIDGEWRKRNFTDGSVKWISITQFFITRPPLGVSKKCFEQKSLDYECLAQVAIDEEGISFSEENKKYLFIRKDSDQEYFLFLEPFH